MEFDLIMLDNDQIGSLGTPLNILVTLQSVWDEVGVATGLVGVVELNVNLFAELV